MARLSLRNLVKRYGQTEVVRGIDLDVADGEFIVLVGPSGCGKSTTLRMIAGLESVTGGTLTIGERVVNTVEPKDRDIAMVFQNYALYPHMSVYRNMAFGLRAAKRPADEIDRKVRKAAEMLGLTPLLERRPHELSGGQRQRVAMGRAIVRDPQVFLFDEPLSNLDAQLRGQVRTEIKRLHQAIGTTIVYVTHDQVEAMTLADRIVIMREGRIEQVGSPLEVFHRPATQFVAGFIGTPTMNLIPMQLSEIGGAPALVREGQNDAGGLLIRIEEEHARRLAGRGTITVGLRPDDLKVAPLSEAPGHRLTGTVVISEPLGPTTQITVASHGLDLIGMGGGHYLPRTGEEVALTFETANLHFFGPDGRRIDA